MRATMAKPKPEKEKRRNNEKRKEKSRDAARCRRSRETEIFQDLASLLPMRPEDVDHLDKASVMRLSIAYLKVRGMLELFPMSVKPEKDAGANEEGEDASMNVVETDGEEDSKAALNELALEKEKLALLSLDGFLMVLSADGDITYVSENVLEYLGISQIDMMGQPIWDYSHQCDHEELREALNGRHHSPSELLKGVANSDCKPLENRDFFLRLKCTLTSRGRSVNIKSASYKVIHVTGHIACKEDGKRQLVAVARPLPHPSNIEVPLDSSTFLSKHSLDMKFTYVDDKMHALLGYNPADLMGKPFYECHHGIDSDHLMGTFKNVINKGQSETARYRFLARTGGYAWVVTQATLIYDKQKPHSIVCVNYVISGVENKDEIYSCAQLEARQQKPTIVDSAPEETVNKSSAAPASAPASAAAATGSTTVKSSDRVLKENINYSNNNDPRNKSTEKEDTEPVIKAIPKVPPPVSVNCGKSVTPGSGAGRPVSVTASIFSSVARKPITTTVAPSTAKPGTSGVAGQEKPPERKGPRSVTATLFKPRPVTDKVFVPRTKDMNKGFLMFSDEEPGLTMLKDEPDDLTHLAPTAGDACIQLEETGQFFNDVFDDFMIPDNYTSLLQDDLSSLDSTDHQLRSSSSISAASPLTINDSVSSAMSQHHHSPNSSSSNSSNISASSSSSSASSSGTSAAVAAAAASSSNSASTSSSLSTVTSGIGTAVSSIVSQNGSGPGGQTVVIGSGSSNDPFINYRDEINEISHSPQHLLSPALSKSPEGSSIPSLCSPNGSGCPEDELAFMTLNMDDDDLDLSMRAPYISMSEVDDLPLLTSDDLMWGAPAAPVDSATAAAMAAAAGKYLIKEEYAPPTQQQLSVASSASSSQGHSVATNTTPCTVPSVGLKPPPVTVTTRIATDFNSNTSNNHNNENNCNIGNKIIDSSLAALLCGGNVINIQTSTIQLPQQQQQQQQQQTQHGNRHILVQHHQQQPQVISATAAQNEGDKRFKLIESNLVQPMVVITPNYKNSNTIDAWTMNDLLQLNGATTGGSTTAATSGSKLNVIASIVSKKNSAASPIVNANTSPVVAHHKRTLGEGGDIGCNKRVKPNPTQSNHQQSPTSSPQLLQQLMAPSPVPAKAKVKSKSLLDQSDQHRWPSGKVNGLQEQASNSVLMNLLVSGCDSNIPEFASDGSIAEDTLRDDNGLIDDDDEDRTPILANPMLGSTANTSLTGQLTIQTDGLGAPSLARGGNVGNDDDDEFMSTVSPSLLTPSDLEIWRAIKQGLDPKKIPQNYGLSLAAGYGDRYPKSMATTPTAQLGMMNDDPNGDTGGNLLSVLDPAMAISRLRTDEDDDDYRGGTQNQQQQQDYEMTIPVNEILTTNLI